MSETGEIKGGGPSTASEWAVYQCANGCLHVRLQHVTLTFSPSEFTQLTHLFHDACTRLGLRPGIASVRAH